MCVCVYVSVCRSACPSVVLPVRLPAGLSVGRSVCLLSAWVKKVNVYKCKFNMYICVSTCVCIPEGQLQRCRHPYLQLNGCVRFQACIFFFHG